MSEAAEREAETDELAPEPAAAATVNEAAGETTDDIELEALAMGWKPESQFKGPKEKFVSAADYVERGKTIMPFLRKELATAYKRIEGLEKASVEAIKHISKAEQRAYTKAKADLEAELETAATAGNAADVKAIAQDIVDLEKEVAAKPATAPEEPAEFTAWKEENPWFGKDKPLTAACAAIGEEALAEGFTGKALVKEVDRRLREQFPAKFAKAENPNRRLPGAVEGAGSARRPSGKGYTDLPPDAKAMCDEMCRDIKGMTREKYAKSYFEDEK